MRTRMAYIENRRNWGDSDVLVDNLKVTKPISAIDVIIRATNGATMNQGNPLHVDVDNLELIDGSRVIHNLSLRDAIIQHCYERGRYPAHILHENAAAVQEETFRISFGRFLGDPEYWLDPGMFDNLQFRLTGPLTISATVGFATGTRDITMIAHVFDERPAGHAGYFSTKQLKTFTSAASGDEETDLPSDGPWRMLGFRARETGIAFDTDITNVKIVKGADEFVMLDKRTVELRDVLAEALGEFELTWRLFRTDADTPSVELAYPRSIAIQALLDLDVASIDGLTVDQITVQLLSLTVAPATAKSTTDTDLLVNARGHVPHFGMVLPMGDLQDPDSWLKGDDIKDQRLLLTQGGAGAAASVWIQQVRN